MGDDMFRGENDKKSTFLKTINRLGPIFVTIKDLRCRCKELCIQDSSKASALDDAYFVRSFAHMFYAGCVRRCLIRRCAQFFFNGLLQNLELLCSESSNKYVLM
jgi:hypothetical protein